MPNSKYLNVLVLLCGLYKTCFEGSEVYETKFNTPHAYEGFAQSVDTAECQLSTLNAFFVWEKICAMFGENCIQFE